MKHDRRADLEGIIRRAREVLNNPVYKKAQAALLEAERLLDQELAALEIRCTVHYPNTNGFSRVPVGVRSTKPGGKITSGPVLVNGERKLKCNIQDNRTGLWVRRNYQRLSDWKKGLQIVYNEDGTSTEQPWGTGIEDTE